MSCVSLSNLKPFFFLSQDGSEILCSGTLTLSRARPPDYGPVISWTQDPQNPAVGGGVSDDSCGSLPGKVFDDLAGHCQPSSILIEILVNLMKTGEQSYV